MATTLTIRNILKKGQPIYKAFANKAIAFVFDIWDSQYQNKTGERGRLLSINGIDIDTIQSVNYFTPNLEYVGWDQPGYDRVKLETVARYSKYEEWSIKEPQYDPTNPAPYLGIYKYLKIISKYPGINPITGLPLLENEVFVDSCLKGVVFGFIDETGTVKDIQGTCGNNIVLSFEDGYVPTKISGCRLDVDPSRNDCNPGSLNFDFTSWNNRPGYSGFVLGDVPVSK